MRKQKYLKFNQLVLLKLPSSQRLNIRSIKSIPVSVIDMNVLFSSLQVVSFFQKHGLVYTRQKGLSQKMMACVVEKPTYSSVQFRKISPIYLKPCYDLRSRVSGSWNTLGLFIFIRITLLSLCRRWTGRQMEVSVHSLDLQM